MDLRVCVRVSLNAQRSDYRFLDRQLGDAACGDADLLYRACRHYFIIPMA
jgi:hypothetical protein